MSLVCADVRCKLGNIMQFVDDSLHFYFLTFFLSFHRGVLNSVCTRYYIVYDSHSPCCRMQGMAQPSHVVSGCGISTFLDSDGEGTADVLRHEPIGSGSSNVLHVRV